VLEWLENIDQQFFLFLNSIRADWLDLPMYAISQTALSAPWFLLLFYLIYRKGGWSKVGISMLALGLVILICDQSSVHLFKNVFQRYRPTHNLDIGHLVHTVTDFNGNEYRGGRYGFLSSHASNMFGAATLMWMFLRPVKTSVFLVISIWTGLVVYTRIYLGVHYLSDIIGGTILGVFVGWFVFHIFQFIESLWKSNTTKTRT
jgi:undecaprenyl-diphosphatase